MTISVQDAAGTNNADFATPAELVAHEFLWCVIDELMNDQLISGTSGRMSKLLKWILTSVHS